MRRTLVWLLLAIVVVACGGQVDKRSDPSDDESMAPPEGEPEGSESSGSYPGDIALPACDVGFPIEERSAFKACSFVVEGLCYETKEAACACACPPRTGTTCLSGFPQHDGEVDVFCD